mgnify:CR=1 FL=1
MSSLLGLGLPTKFKLKQKPIEEAAHGFSPISNSREFILPTPSHEARPQSWLTVARPNACVCFSDVSKSQRSPTLQSLRSAARARHWLRSFLLIVTDTKSAAQPRSQPAGSHATVCITLVSQNLENEDEVIRTNAKRQAVQADNQGRCCLQEA